MNNAELSEIAGITVPDSQLCNATIEFARRVSEPYLLHHVVRSYGFGEAVGRASKLSYDSELLFAGAILHDIGLTDFVPGNERFELEGADAAKQFLAEQGMIESHIDIVWDAIALHTTQGIPQRKRPEIALVQTGAALDIGAVPLKLIPDSFLEQLLEEWPRLGMKEALVGCLHGLYKRNPATAASQVVADVAIREEPSYAPFNLCDVIRASAFSE